MRFAAFDISSVSTGVAIVDMAPNGRLSLVHTDIITTNPKHQTGRRLISFFSAVQELLEQYKPDHVIKETTIARMATQHIMLKFAGVWEMVVYDLGFPRFFEYGPTTVKKMVGGHGRATKQQVAEGLLSCIDVDLESMIDDETDALGLVLTHVAKTATLIPLKELSDAAEFEQRQQEAMKEVGVDA